MLTTSSGSLAGGAPTVEVFQELRRRHDPHAWVCEVEQVAVARDNDVSAGVVGQGNKIVVVAVPTDWRRSLLRVVHLRRPPKLGHGSVGIVTGDVSGELRSVKYLVEFAHKVWRRDGADLA